VRHQGPTGNAVKYPRNRGTDEIGEARTYIVPGRRAGATDSAMILSPLSGSDCEAGDKRACKETCYGRKCVFR